MQIAAVLHLKKLVAHSSPSTTLLVVDLRMRTLAADSCSGPSPQLLAVVLVADSHGRLSPQTLASADPRLRPSPQTLPETLAEALKFLGPRELLCLGSFGKSYMSSNKTQRYGMRMTAAPSTSPPLSHPYPYIYPYIFVLELLFTLVFC